VRPYDAFEAAGHEVTVIGLKRGKQLAGKKGDVEVAAEKGIGEVSDSGYDAVWRQNAIRIRASPDEAA
jgi:protease I